MKKIICILISVMMIFGLVACSKRQPTQTYTLDKFVDLYLPIEYTATPDSYSIISKNNVPVATMQFGNEISYRHIEDYLDRNADPTATLLDKNTKDNIEYLYYSVPNEDVVDYVYVIYIVDSDISMVLYNNDQTELDAIFNNMSLEVSDYPEESGGVTNDQN